MMYLIMVVAGIGMFVGLQKEKNGAAWGRPVAILCILVALGAAAFQMIGGGKGGPGAGIEIQYRQIKGEKLGSYLAEKFPGKRVLLLLPPEAPVMSGEQAQELPYVVVLKGFEKAKKDLQIVGKIEPKMPQALKDKVQKAMSGGQGGEMGEMMMPEAQMWFGVNELNKELVAYKGKYDILVCLTGLPGLEMMSMGNQRVVPFSKLTVWNEKDVSVALADGGVAKLGRLIQSKKICAAVTYKQGIPEEAYEKQPSSDLDEAFNTRFVLITPDNLKENMAYFPSR